MKYMYVDMYTERGSSVLPSALTLGRRVILPPCVLSGETVRRKVGKPVMNLILHACLYIVVALPCK